MAEVILNGLNWVKKQFIDPHKNCKTCGEEIGNRRIPLLRSSITHSGSPKYFNITVYYCIFCNKPYMINKNGNVVYINTRIEFDDNDKEKIKKKELLIRKRKIEKLIKKNNGIFF